MSTTEWYWCLTHQRAEPAEARDDVDHALGPYPTEADARDWKRIHDEREAEWEAEDAAWEGGDDA